MKEESLKIANKEPIRIKADSKLAKMLLWIIENRKLYARYLSKEITFEEYKKLGGKKGSKILKKKTAENL